MRILSELKIWPNELSNTDHTQVWLSTETIQENLTATTFNQMGVYCHYCLKSIQICGAT